MTRTRTMGRPWTRRERAAESGHVFAAEPALLLFDDAPATPEVRVIIAVPLTPAPV
jgi:hypothetical protein